MLKSALLATAICFAFVVPASAQQKINCDETSLMKMRTDIDAMTDKEKQTTTIASWEAAMAAMKANNMAECDARIGETGKGMGGVGGDDASSATTTN